MSANDTRGGMTAFLSYHEQAGVAGLAKLLTETYDMTIVAGGKTLKTIESASIDAIDANEHGLGVLVAALTFPDSEEDRNELWCAGIPFVDLLFTDLANPEEEDFILKSVGDATLVRWAASGKRVVATNEYMQDIVLTWLSRGCPHEVQMRLWSCDIALRLAAKGLFDAADNFSEQLKAAGGAPFEGMPSY